MYICLAICRIHSKDQISLSSPQPEVWIDCNDEKTSATSLVAFLRLLMDISDLGKKHSGYPVKILEVYCKPLHLTDSSWETPILLLSSKGKASTCWCEFLAGPLTRDSLGLYTAAIEVIKGKIALPEQKPRASEGGHTMSVHCFIPTWLQKTTVENLRQKCQTE